MNQDFNKSQSNRFKELPADPNLITTPAIKGRINERHAKYQSAQIYTQALLSLVTAPFITTHVSLQLSVLPHKNLYGDTVQQDAKDLAKISKEVTVQDRRKFELLIKSGAQGTNRPFTAPIYNGYRDVLKGLSNQGILGFYKGNFVGLLHTLCTSTLRFSSTSMLDYSNYKFYHQGNAFIRGVAMFSICTLIDVVCQPLMTIQSRFILQNRLPNFTLYKSIIDVVKRHKKNPFELYKGSMGHGIKNVVQGFTWALYDKNNPVQSFLISSCVANVLSYPIYTGMRRVQCQSPLPGMIPKRYSGTFHAMRLIAQEEGLKGLYRGFIAYAVVVITIQLLIIHCFIDDLIQKLSLIQKILIEYTQNINLCFNSCSNLF